MQPSPFDALSRLIARRGLLRGFLGSTGIATYALHADYSAALSFCAERPKGATCKQNGQCCSDDCKRKKGKKKGKCTCSELLEHCATDGDCCGHKNIDLSSPACNFISGGSTIAVCCVPTGGACTTADECCNSTAACFMGVCALL